MRDLTINQILDKISNIKIGEITPEIGEIRQELIDRKKQGGAKGGLIFVKNTQEILRKINS